MELPFLAAYAIAFYTSMLWLSWELSSGREIAYLRGLRPGWLFNRYIDLSDVQWRVFRENLPILIVVMSAFVGFGLLLRRTFKLRSTGMSRYWLTVSLVYLGYMHGFCVLFVVAIAIGNYAIVKMTAGTAWLPILVWAYNIFFLIANRVFEGYRFSSFGDNFAVLDDHRGTVRWHIGFNLVMLRMVSFGLDYHWSRIYKPSTINWTKHSGTCDACRSNMSCYTSRQETSLPSSSYNFVTYLTYLIYAPLYIAGPIVSFNAFASQLETSQNTHKKLNVALYGLRWLLCLILMEFLTHFVYYNAFAISGIWPRLSAVQIFIVGYGVLNFMWLKFLLIWRFFRFWALVDGIEAPENMQRCVNNCYDLEGFWKGWHSSYNRWLVRYLYVPLGGSKWKLLNVWVIFTFVALWHDLEWKLLSWAWLTCLLWVPEIVVKYLLAKSTKMQQIQTHRPTLYRELSAIAAAFNITGLMTANVVGFVAGPSGAHKLASSLLVKENVGTICTILFSFYVGAKIMFRVREARHKGKSG